MKVACGKCGNWEFDGLVGVVGVVVVSPNFLVLSELEFSVAAMLPWWPARRRSTAHGTAPR